MSRSGWCVGRGAHILLVDTAREDEQYTPLTLAVSPLAMAHLCSLGRSFRPQKEGK